MAYADIATIVEEDKKYRSVHDLKDELRSIKYAVRHYKDMMNIPYADSDASLSDIESNDGIHGENQNEEDTPFNVNDDDD